MNPGDGSPNRLVRVLERFPLANLRHTATLGIYSVSASTMQAIAPLLEAHRGPISYRSLQGIKDLRLQSTGQPLPLLHVQWGETVSSPTQPLAGYTHMFCVPTTDTLAQDLAHQHLQPQATASIVSQGMEGSDWRFVLTSDI